MSSLFCLRNEPVGQRANEPEDEQEEAGLSCANAIAGPARKNAAPTSAAPVGREASQRAEAGVLLESAPRAGETHLARPAPEIPLALLSQELISLPRPGAHPA